MTIRGGATRVLWYECIGFSFLIMLSWVGQAERWPEYLFGGEPQLGDWRFSAMETLLILCIWGLVFGLTKKLVNHLHYLEGFVRICAWCRKVGYQKGWVRLESYFSEGFQVQTTHGMCPDCRRRLEEETRPIIRPEKITPPQGEADGSTAPTQKVGVGVVLPSAPIPTEAKPL